MPYSQFTLGQFVAAISGAMQDPGNVFWSTDEITRAISEALLYWGALTSYWRDRGTFTTSPNTFFYDLSVQLPTLRTRTYTVDMLCREIQYMLFEQAHGLSGAGMTLQFTVAQIAQALQSALDQFNMDSDMPLTFSVLNTVTAPPDGRIPLDQSVIGVSRVAWKDASTGIWTNLRREDEYSAQSYSPDWNLNPGQPIAYAMATAPPLVLQLIPPPLAAGNIGLVFSESLDPSVTVIDMPDEYVCAVKYYALYQLLSTYNEGYDPYRAKYAFERYGQIVEASKAMRSLNRVQINGRLIGLDTIWNLDAGLPQWMNMTGLPNRAATAWDLLALAPLATSTCSVLCDVVRTAPLPQTTADPIPLGREELSYISDYVRHLLSFKIGGSEFGATFPLHDNFLAGAKQRNEQLTERVRYLTPLFDQAKINDSQLQTA